ncbi:alpha/beta fold hydrolase [Variovorax defluvii]|uniref:Alpha/beta fold hydrolase n=1 Tax=Variovorax defluvii TaxID=913761 RepID=A0ABP8HDP5_9BURK
MHPPHTVERHAEAAEIIFRMESSGCVRDVDCGGSVVRWRIFGSGSPLVLLHGGHGSWLHWVRNVSGLATRHRVLVPDMPGFNDSEDLRSSPRSSDPLADVVAALRCGIASLIGPDTPIDLVGFSFGGLVATRWASEMPIVRRLALIGPAGHGRARRQLTPLEDWRAADSPSARREALRQNLYSFMLHSRDGDDELALTVHERSCVRTRFRSKALSRAGGLTGLLDRIDVPVLTLWGENDVTAHPESVAELLRNGRSDREWCLISGAGHWVQYESADRVNELLLSWFKPEI